ncbi:MAG: nucleotidyltransferase [Chlorobi bacterium]|nr:nucleotidyltransferase [Chlorobiota bacterium]
MFLDNYKNKIVELCEKHKVKHLFVLGSVLTDGFSNDSDIDFLVDINTNDPIAYAENYFNFKFELENLLKRKIDLLKEKAIKNSYFIESINNSKQLIYED